MLSRRILTLCLTASAVFMLNACQDSATSPENDSLTSTVKEDQIPEEAFHYTLEDYQNMFQIESNTMQALAKQSGNMSLMTMEQLAAVAKDVKYFVPNFNTIQTESQLKEVEKLLGMTRKQIVKDADGIRNKRIAGHRYLLYKAIIGKFKNGLVPVPLQKTAYFYGLNSAEFWLLFYSPTFIDGTRQAKDDALAFEREYYSVNSAKTRGDAYRHSIWNHLMADYNSHEVNYKSEAVAWAKKFSDAHETGREGYTGFYDYNYFAITSPLETPMDYHNNARGRDHFLSVSTNRGKLSWWGYDSRWVETESVAISKPKFYTKAQAAVQITSTSQLPGLASKFVFIQ